MAYLDTIIRKGTEYEIRDTDAQNKITQITDDMIAVSDTQPSGDSNKVWIKETADEVDVPTMAEHNALAADVAQNTEDISDLDTRLDGYENIFTGNVDTSVQNWLGAHPEATTAVQDGSITAAKLASGVIDPTLSISGAAAEAKATGDAVGELRSAFDELLVMLESGDIPIFPEYELGGFIGSTGQNVDNAQRIRSSLIELPANTQIYVKVASGFLVGAGFFDSSNVWHVGSASTTDFTFNSGSDGNKWKFQILAQPETNVTSISERASKALIYYNSGFVNTFENRGYISVKVPTGDITLANDAAETGWYESGNLAGRTITDYPADFLATGVKYFTLVNFSSFFSMIASQDSADPSLVCIKTDGAWHRLSRDFNNEFLYRGSIASMYPTGDITLATMANKYGFYLSGDLRNRTITDLPDIAYGVKLFVLINFPSVSLLVLLDGSGIIVCKVGNNWQGLYGQPGGTWVRLGDSLTLGTISAGGVSGVNREAGYQYLANKKFFHKKDINLGVGGMGFVHAINNKTACDVVDDIGTTYNGEYITVAYGLNDYIYASPLGTENSTANDGTVYGNIRYVLETLMTNNPKSSITVITPMNAIDTGTAETDYDLGTPNRVGVTLEDIFQAIKYWCDKYHAFMVDLTHNSIFGTMALPTILNDSVHPIAEAQVKMASWISNLLPII